MGCDVDERGEAEGDGARKSSRDDALSDRLVTPERSVFGTRLPRPVGVGRHLLVVILLSLIALGITIAFAERDAADPAIKPDAKRFAPAGK